MAAPSKILFVAQARLNFAENEMMEFESFG